MTFTTFIQFLRSAGAVLVLGAALLHPFESRAQDLDLTALTGAPNAFEFNTIGMAYDSYRGVMRTHYLGYDNHVHEMGSSVLQKFGWIRGVQRWDVDLTAMTGAPRATAALAIAFDPNRNTMRTHYVAYDNHVHELGVSPAGQWWDADLTAMTGAPLAFSGGSIAIAFDPTFKAMRTHYVAVDHHVHELGLSSAGQWWTADLTAMTGAPPASGTLAIAFDLAYNAMRTHYVAFHSSNNVMHLHELGVNGAAQWWDADLTAITGGPEAGGLVAIAFDPVKMTTRTHYCTRYSAVPMSGNHPAIRELSVAFGQWQGADLTTPIGAATVSMDLAIAFDPAAGTMRTLYRSDNWHMHELRLAGSQWQHTDLTVMTGGPLLSGALGMAFDPVRNGLVAHYVSTDKHVHELFPIP